MKQAAIETGEMLKRFKPEPVSWVEQAGKEVRELQDAAKADPKVFWGNRVRGTGDGLARVKVLLPAVKNLLQILNDLDRSM